MKIAVPRSNWTVAGLLTQLPRYRRVDGGGDELACRLACETSSRSAYVYLSVEEPELIHFSLEDAESQSRDWNDSEERGSVLSVADLSLVLRWWLRVPARVA